MLQSETTNMTCSTMETVVLSICMLLATMAAMEKVMIVPPSQMWQTRALPQFEYTETAPFTLVLHIGVHKTATTYFQTGLASVCDKLLKARIFHPSGCKSHVERFMNSTDFATDQPQGCPTLIYSQPLSFFKAALNSTPHGWTHLWSCESMSALSQPHVRMLHAAAHNATTDVRVLMVLRSPSRWAMSLFAESSYSVVANPVTSATYYTFQMKGQLAILLANAFRNIFSHVEELYYDGIITSKQDIFDVLIRRVEPSVNVTDLMKLAVPANTRQAWAVLTWDIATTVQLRFRNVHNCSFAQQHRVLATRARTRGVLCQNIREYCDLDVMHQDVVAHGLERTLHDTAPVFEQVVAAMRSRKPEYFQNATSTANPAVYYANMHELEDINSTRTCMDLMTKQWKLGWFRGCADHN